MVNAQLSHLIELQEIDTRILEIGRSINDIPRRLREAESSLQSSHDALKKTEQQRDALEKKKREKERALDDANEKIVKLKSRTGEIKTNKEYQALLREIEAVERERSLIEDEIIALMVDADSLQRQIRAAEDDFRKRMEEVEARKKRISEEQERLETHLLSLQDTRKKIRSMIDGEIYDEYIQLIELHRGFAVSEVRGEICQGCNMNIPPQLFVEIKKNEEIYHCPHCRRILFYREPAA